MKQRTVYISNDGTTFNNPKHCDAYEKILEAVISLECICDNREELQSIQSFVTGATGEDIIQRAMACLFWSTELAKAIPELGDILPDLLTRKTLNTWKDELGGLSREITDMPIDATPEEIGRLVRKYSSDRVATALETLEDTPIPLSTYKAIRRYLSLE